MRPLARLLPRSLIGQTVLALAGALLVAQAISATLLYRAADQRREAALVGALAFQFAAGPRFEERAERRERRGRPSTAPRRFGAGEGPRRNEGALPWRLRYTATASSPLQSGETRDAAREAALRDILEQQGVAVAELAVAERTIARDPAFAELAARFPRMARRIGENGGAIAVAGLRREGAAQWEVARAPLGSPDRRILGTLAVQTLILVAVLTLLLWLVLRRIARPLADLAERTQSFSGTDAPAPLEPSGPEDIRRLIAAHNAMQARIGAMLDEKDVMLGAIGHDLKTPLAALRVRIESVADEAQRDRMTAGIAEITRTLDEILLLARVGRSDAPAERVELGALAGAVVEEFEDMGEPVTMEESERLVAPVHLTWLKRGLRNLVTNALRYGGSAQVSVLREGGRAVLRVEDAGPGIPQTRIAAMVEPFARGEASRNRATGGAGLGLTIARAVAERHGGELVLANRTGGGLRAEIRVPG